MGRASPGLGGSRPTCPCRGRDCTGCDHGFALHLANKAHMPVDSPRPLVVGEAFGHPLGRKKPSGALASRHPDPVDAEADNVAPTVAGHVGEETGTFAVPVEPCFDHRLSPLRKPLILSLGADATRASGHEP